MLFVGKMVMLKSDVFSLLVRKNILRMLQRFQAKPQGMLTTTRPRYGGLLLKKMKNKQVENRTLTLNLNTSLKDSQSREIF